MSKVYLNLDWSSIRESESKPSSTYFQFSYVKKYSRFTYIYIYMYTCVCTSMYA